MEIEYNQITGLPVNPVFVPTDFVMGPRGEYDVDSPRKLFAQLREDGMLSEYSKGKVAMTHHDGFTYVIDKNKYHPLFVIMPAIPTEEMASYDRSICSLIHESLMDSARLLNVDVSEFEGMDDQYGGEVYDQDDNNWL
jgi:hypothetical protein